MYVVEMFLEHETATKVFAHVTDYMRFLAWAKENDVTIKAIGYRETWTINHAG